MANTRVPIDTTTILKRIDQLLATDLPAGDIPAIYAAVVEAMQGTLTLSRLLYGSTDETPQVQTLVKAAQKAREQKQVVAFSFYETVWPAVRGTLGAMKADVEAGLVGNIERRAAGEIVADMLGLAKEALAEGSDGAKNVAAVLAAAAYEDTIRKIPRWTGQNRPLVDTSKPAISDERIEASEFYRTLSPDCKSVWTFVRQLRGPHFSTCA